MNRQNLNEILALVGSLLKESPFRCIETEWHGHDRILRLYLDSDKGVVLDDCARISRELEESAAFQEVISGAYNLEVSSPGVERPLRLQEDFKRFLGEEVELRARTSGDARNRKFRGVLKSVSEDGSSVEISSESGLASFLLDQVSSAKLVPDWDKIVKGEQDKESSL